MSVISRPSCPFWRQIKNHCRREEKEHCCHDYNNSKYYILVWENNSTWQLDITFNISLRKATVGIFRICHLVSSPFTGQPRQQMERKHRTYVNSALFQHGVCMLHRCMYGEHHWANIVTSKAAAYRFFGTSDFDVVSYHVATDKPSRPRWRQVPVYFSYILQPIAKIRNSRKESTWHVIGRSTLRQRLFH